MIKEGFHFSKPDYQNPEKTVKEYSNWITWQPPPFPREIIHPQNFSCPEQYLQGLNKLEDAIQKGVPLYPWMSRYVCTKPKYVDFFYHHFNIHHFHLGTTVSPKHKVLYNLAENGMLAYFWLAPTKAYLIKIAPHEFSDDKLLDDVQMLYPELYPGNSQPYTPCIDKDNPILLSREDTWELLNNNIGTFRKSIDGNYYCLPKIGTMDDGSSYEAMRYFFDKHNRIKYLQIKFVDFIQKSKNSFENENIHYCPWIENRLIVSVGNKRYTCYFDTDSNIINIR